MRWAGELLTARALNASGEDGQQRMDASFAWDALSRPYIQDRDFQKAIDATLLTGTAMRQSNLVTLNPHASKLIHAMADAVGVPFPPDQTIVDLLPTQERKQLFRRVYTQIARKAGI